VHTELADHLLAAITSGDTDTARGLYAPGALIWHNGPGPGGGEEQGIDGKLRTLRWLARNLTGMTYDDIRRDPLPGGYVQRHVLRAHMSDGPQLEIAACLFVTRGRRRPHHAHRGVRRHPGQRPAPRPRRRPAPAPPLLMARADPRR
jgi:uncharacterized protein